MQGIQTRFDRFRGVHTVARMVSIRTILWIICVASAIAQTLLNTLWPDLLSRYRALGGVLAVFSGGSATVHKWRENSRRDRSVEYVLGTLCEILQKESQSGQTRANIMIADRHGRLRIKYHCGFDLYHKGELGIVWEKGMGCAGKAYLENEIILGNLKEINSTNSYKEFSKHCTKKYMITEEQWEKTKHLRVILSFPICYNGRVIGVLNVDDTAHYSNSVLRGPDAFTRCELVAQALGNLLLG